ncbi:hypothetical protein DFH11DRAFT_1512543, partial [Phellopilus nigrolimitatus]
YLPLSDNAKTWVGLEADVKAQRKTSLLIDHVKQNVPAVLGEGFSEIIVSFLRAGYDDEAFGVSLETKSETEVSLVFFSRALEKLQEIYEEYSEKK